MYRPVMLLLIAGSVLSMPSRSEPAGGITARTIRGDLVKPLDGTGRKATVLLFIAHDCPVSNSYAPEFNRISQQYAPQKVSFYTVYVEPDLKLTEARTHAHDYGYVCPALLDPQHRLVKLAGATVTPEAVVFAANGQRVYHGRIDNRYAAIGRRREVVTKHDLRDVLDAVLKHKSIAEVETTAVGCFIPPVK